MDIPADIPGEMYGAPTVQVAQAQSAQDKCDPTEYYLIKNQPYKLKVTFNEQSGKRDYALVAENNKESKPQNVMVTGGGISTFVTFPEGNYTSVNANKGTPKRSFTAINYGTGQRTTHEVVPQPEPKERAKNALPACTPNLS